MRRIGIIVLVALAGGPSGARAEAGQKDAEEVLRAQGLTRWQTCYCLADELALDKLLVGPDCEAAKRKTACDEAQARAERAARLESVRRQHLSGLDGVPEYGRPTIGHVGHLPPASAAGAAVPQTAQAAAAQERESYVGFVLQMRKRYDALRARYKELAADGEVRTALDRYNAFAFQPCHLGPMKGTYDALKKLESDVTLDAIPIHGANGNWLVYVTVNDKPATEFVIDTGAAQILLPYKTAETLGLRPTRASPESNGVLADGRPVTCHLVTAATVRVGRFELRNVRCSVLPEDCPHATPLLGMNFLEKFTFQLDQNRGVLIMAGLEERATPHDALLGHGQRPVKSSEVGSDKLPSSDSTPAHRVARFLAVAADANSRSQGDMVLHDRGGKLVFHPSQRVSAKTLLERVGDPDEVHKVPAPPLSRDAPQAAPAWKMWTWGNVKVLVDDFGYTRYYCLDKP